jgi:hypothetical protein
MNQPYWIIRFRDNNRWKKVRHSSGDLKRFNFKGQARRYCKNHLLYLEDKLQLGLVREGQPIQWEDY